MKTPSDPFDGLDRAERVRLAVRAIPPGTAATYGDVAELVGECTARQAGQIMATDAAETPWWRVVNASGRLPDHLLAEARGRWSAEGFELTADATGVRLRHHRVDPQLWASRLADRGVPGHLEDG